VWCVRAMRPIFIAFTLFSSVVLAPAQTYSFFTFAADGAALTTATGINNSGQIAGNFSDAAGWHAFIRTGSVYTAFEAPGASRTVAAGINNPGQITGNYTDAAGTHGFIRSADGKTFTTFDVSTPQAPTMPVAINDQGAVVGTVSGGSGGANGFLRTADGAITAIRFPLANFTSPRGITNAGEIAGTYINGGPLENRHGFLRHPDGTYVTMDVPGIESTDISAINNHGDIAGVVEGTHAFVEDSSGVITILDALGGVQTLPAGINDSREVAGSTYGNNTSQGFLAIAGQGTSRPEIRPVRGVISASGFGGSGAIAPGTWIEIYGQNLAPVTRQWNVDDFSGAQAPTSLDGVTVMINGTPATIAFISPGQINAQAPSTLVPGQAQVIVRNNGRISSSYQVDVNALQPGLLQIPGPTVALTYAAAVLPDHTYALPPGFGFNGPSRRAHAGETVTFYGIGFGPIVPDEPAGRIATGQASLAARLEVRFGATPAVVSYSGPAPGLVGIYQFNVVVPDGVLSPAQTYDDRVAVIFELNCKSQAQTLLTTIER